MPEIEVVLFCPNKALLQQPWTVVADDILRPRSKKAFVSNVIQMAKALGEINRFHSSKLPDKYLIVLHKRMTELRKIVKAVEKRSNREVIPWEQLEYFFSGEERKDMKR